MVQQLGYYGLLPSLHCSPFALYHSLFAIRPSLVMHILVINAGSSSLKYQLFALPSDAPLCRGQIERIGLDGSSIRHQVDGQGPAQIIERN